MYSFKLTSFIIALMLLAFAGSVKAQNKKYNDETEAQIKKVENNLAALIQLKDSNNTMNLQERMAFYKVKGLSIAVVKDYKIIWARGYGWADEAEGKRVTPQTLFQAASISKSLNGIGVLKLVQDKKLDLYRDINDYLVTWKFPYDSVSKGKKITTANLLSHTAGLSVHGFPGYANDDTIPSLPQILDGKAPANTQAVRSLWEPGLRYKYSGGGTTISQQLLMDITKQPYHEYMSQQVL
jgi:CubicO group peptidase (beta-lactamase class C family)